ncbi:CDP-diacylglycerol--inositol 3-phosphatidyltransferase [Thelohanellus kitauei]|uniref:CDP-diacylglycerol--inositol 3-phosphatidyltransferase n=1 Tax=Thelohanellus kitauei TaxID=669202 RepID=A0A0C2M8N0_THEKT|nr:CDP-diacylglycerol--inositol 3-phosphatidyltransferase [Thelohanellus kitauei]
MFQKKSTKFGLWIRETSQHHQKSPSSMTTSVFLYIPNIVDYVRLALLLASCYYMPKNYLAALILYGLSQIFDALDEGSYVGVVLDMLIDRVSTLLIYKKWCMAFQVLAALDIFSHWSVIYMSSMYRMESHKFYTKKDNPVLYFYYTSKVVLGTVCVGNEMFLLLIYVLKMCQVNKCPPTYSKFFRPMVIFCLPIFAFKQLTNVIQLIHSLQKLAELKVSSSKKQQ